ncbi:MAG: metal ABC transporter permease [bacterium]|nr:metal ABC transporter permease [bacterium]
MDTTSLSLLLTLPFFQRAVLGGVIIAAVAAYVGVQVVIRRSSFLGDALAHTVLTGVALGLWWQINPFLTMLALALIIGVILANNQFSNSKLPLDNLLGALLPTAMALGIVIIALIPGYQSQLLSYLFGNILTIGSLELSYLLVLGLAVSVITYWYRRQLILVAIDKDMAQTSGVAVKKIELIFHLVLALTVVGAVQLVGVVLVNALLIVPATITRTFARSLKTMLVLAPVIAVIVTISGIALSAIKNLPTGPVVALVAGGVLVLAIALSSRPLRWSSR